MTGSNPVDARLGVLKRYFFNRSDVVAVMAPWRKPCPARPRDSLDDVVLAHLLGDRAPEISLVASTKRGDQELSGRFRIGSYGPAQDGTTLWLCLDFDGKGHTFALADAQETALACLDAFSKAGLKAYLERSGGGQGWHVWVFFERPLPAALARALGLAFAPRDAVLADEGIANAASGKVIEIFPKQKRIAANRFGNMVWLPWWHGTPDGANAFYRVEGDSLRPLTPDSFEAVSLAQVERLVRRGGEHRARKSTRKREYARWRTEALARLPLEDVYGKWLTGVKKEGWWECRDPSSRTGDQHPSAGIADGTGEAERGSFHSFISGRTIPVFNFLVEHGRAADFFAACRLVGELAGLPYPAMRDSTPEQAPLDSTVADWDELAAENGIRSFGKTYASLCLILRRDRRILPEPVRFDEMLWSPTVAGSALEDHDTAKIRERIELHQKDSHGVPLRFGIEDIERAVAQVAHEQRFHPVRDYLSSLVWDGTPRIDAVAEEILGAPRTEMNQLLVRKWFIGAATRPLDPGCKMDTVLVLVGPQYLGKSAFFSTLVARPSWFTDAHVDVDNRGSLLILQSVWILEWAELATMQRTKDLETLKAFITSRTNRFRLPYGRRIVDRPRHAVIVGTTNKAEFLADRTGNRRFWPISVRQRIDLTKLAEWRDQLWAEAVAAAKRRERWWLDEDEDHKLAVVHAPHEEHHPWEEPIRQWLSSNSTVPVTTALLLEEAIRKPRGQWNRRDDMTVATILRRLGYDRPNEARKFDDEGRRVRVWVRNA